MENIKALRAEIKMLSYKQRVLKLNRKTVNFPTDVVRTYSSDEAQYKVQLNKDRISVLLTALSILRGKDHSHIPTCVSGYAKRWYDNEVKKAVDLYAFKEETVCADK